jgi:putative transposase
MLEYKCKLKGIKVVLVNEAYTSRCSFIDNEKICKHDKYKGSRIKRGLFKTESGLLINSDVNGSYNILRNVVAEFKYTIGVVSVNPVKVKVH